MVSTRGIYTKALYGTFAVILLLQLYTLPFHPYTPIQDYSLFLFGVGRSGGFGLVCISDLLQ